MSNEGVLLLEALLCTYYQNHAHFSDMLMF